MRDLEKNPLTPEILRRMNAYWRAANYLSVGQIYLLDNPLLRKPLTLGHIKPRLLGHWGTTPGLNFIYVHLNRIIKQHDLEMIYVAGPGHGGPGVVANVYLEGTYTEHYPDISQDEDGMRRLFRQFSFPGGIPSHVAPDTPGSIHEGGELGYSLAHAYGASFDNPELIVACVVGDGEAETGPLATSWHSNKFLNPARDGAVLPILHLNGYKIAGPTVLARIPQEELRALFHGYGYEPYFVEGSDPAKVHQLMAATLDAAVADIEAIQKEARAHGFRKRARWPMVVLRTPKGWTGPKIVDGKPSEGTWRAHQVPFGEMQGHPAHVKLLEKWMKSYKPEELFDRAGRLRPELGALAPEGQRRMGANPRTNGGTLLRDLRLPDFREYAVEVKRPGATEAEATRRQGEFLRDVMRLNADARNFRVFSPDETSSNRWNAVFEATDRCSTAEPSPLDENVSPDGRVMEILSEHMCQGWLEGYLLTGRHGFFSCYEAFIHIVDSMFNQHAKWLKSSKHVPWRQAHRVAQLPPHVPRLAPGPQRVQPPGSRIHRSRGQQEGRHHPGVPAARREHSPVGHGPLPAQPALRERDSGRKTARAAVARHGRGGQALHRGHRNLGVGLERPGRRAGRGHGLRGRRSHARDAGRGGPAAPPLSRSQGARGQRRRPHDPPARE